MPSVWPEILTKALPCPCRCWWMNGKSLTKTSKQNLSCAASSYSSSQEIPRNLLNPNGHYDACKKPPLILTLRQINSAHVFLTYFFKNNFNIILPTTCRSSKLLLLPVPPSKHSTHFSFPSTWIRATSPPWARHIYQKYVTWGFRNKQLIAFFYIHFWSQKSRGGELFWVLIPWTIVHWRRRFIEWWCLHLQGCIDFFC